MNVLCAFLIIIAFFLILANIAGFPSCVSFATLAAKIRPSPTAAIGPLVTLSLLLAVPASARAQGFSDVPAGSPYAAATAYLKEKGVLSGYADNTFRPSLRVNRAEALKMIIAPLADADALAAATSSPFGDVPEGAWFLPYVELARTQFRAIDGPPAKANFLGANPVKKAEFLKMLFAAYGIDAKTAYGDLTIPIANDVLRSDEWFYPVMRYGVTASMLLVNPDGTLEPQQELTRGDVALLLHRFLTYREGRRTQALLSAAESDILNVLKMFEEQNIIQAELASARAMLAARGALHSKPEEPLVKGAVKTAEGFRALVRAYQAGAQGKYDESIALAKDAWQLAERAKEFSPSLATLAGQMQTVASSMADEARTLKAR